MPQHQDHMRDGATAARSGQPAPDPARLADIERTAKAARIHPNWLGEDGRSVSFSARIGGFTPTHLYTSAESTGGSKSDVLTLPWQTSHSTDDHGNAAKTNDLIGDLGEDGFGSKRWTFSGEIENDPDREPDTDGIMPKRVRWTGMRPAED